MAGCTLYASAIAGLEEQMHRLLQMMEEANAGMCSTLKTLASATRSSTPSSSPTSPASSTPTAAPVVAAPPSTSARNAASTPTTTTTTTILGAIDVLAEPTAASTSWSTPTAVLPAPRSATTTKFGAIDEYAVSWSFSSKHAAVIPAAHPRATIPSTTSPTVVVLDVHRWSSTPATPISSATTVTSTIVQMATTVRPLPTPASAISSTEDDAINTSPTRCSTTRLCRSSNMLVSGSSVNTISTVPPSSATHTLAKQVAAPAVGMSQYAHQVLKVTSTSYYPFSVNHGKCYDSVMLWPPPVSHARSYSATCVFDRGKSSKDEFIFTLLQAVISIFMLGIHSLTLQIELKPWPNWHGHQGSLIVPLVYPHSSIVIWVQFSCSVHKLLVWSLNCKSWWECCAACCQLLANAGQVDSIKMEAIGLIQFHIAIPLRDVYCLLFTCYHQPVEWKPPWLSLVYIISNIPYVAYSLRIRISIMPHLFLWSVVAKLKFGDVQYKKFFGKVMAQCLYTRYLVSQLSLDAMSFQLNGTQLHCKWLLTGLPQWFPGHLQCDSVEHHNWRVYILWMAFSILCPVWIQTFLSYAICDIEWWTHNMWWLSTAFWQQVMDQYLTFIILASQLVHMEEQKALPGLWPLAQDSNLKFLSITSVSILLIHVTTSGWLLMSRKAIQALSCEVDPFGVFEFTISQRTVLCARNMHHLSRRFYPLMSYHLLEGISCYITLYHLRDGQMACALSPNKNPIQLEHGELLHTMGPMEKKHQLLNPNALLLAHLFSLNGHPILVEYSKEPIVLSQIQQPPWEVFLRKIPVFKHATTMFPVQMCSKNGAILQCSYAKELLLIGTVSIRQPLSAVGHLLYSGKTVQLPLASSILFASCDDEELEHDKIIFSSSQATIFMGLQLHLVFELTDFHANEADQSYFLGAWAAIYGEWFASKFVRPTVPVIQFQASTSQNSRIMEVTYKTMTGSTMLALQFYNLMVEDP